MSGWRKQINLVIIAPYNDKLSSIYTGTKFIWYILIIRISPYPPSFSRIAARIIDPAIGASTCALGNHRWVENIGSLTRNPKININQKKFEFIDGGNIMIKDDDIKSEDDVE